MPEQRLEIVNCVNVRTRFGTTQGGRIQRTYVHNVFVAAARAGRHRPGRREFKPQSPYQCNSGPAMGLLLIGLLVLFLSLATATTIIMAMVILIIRIMMVLSNGGRRQSQENGRPR